MKYFISNMEIIKKSTFDRIYAFQVAMVVAKERSFVKASKILETSPSNITKEIKKLEELLGIKLFHRTTRSITLTEDGEIALEKANDIFEIMEDMNESIHGSKSSLKGMLRVTAPTTLGQFFLSDIFTDFQLKNPYIEMDLILTDRVLDPIDYNIDLSIRTAYSLDDSSMYARKIGKIDRVICASKKYLELFKKPKTPESLDHHNCLLYMRGDSPFVWHFKKGTKNKNVKVSGSYKSNNLLSLIDACEKGIGVLNIPRYLVQDKIDDGTFEVLFKTWQLPAYNVFLLSSKKPSSSKKLQALEDFIEENFY